MGCQRDKAGNRELFMDQYCSLVLLFLFNPCVRSLRALQQASELKNVQRKLGCGRSSLGSLSEATDVFDPERLRQIIGELAAEVKPSRDRADDYVKHVVTAVDGSVVQTLSTIAEAAYLKTKNGDSRSAWRLHTHFDVDRGVPTRIDVTSGKNSGKTDEKNVLREQLAADHCYVMDRWYAQFTLFNEIHASAAATSAAFATTAAMTSSKQRPLSDAARAAGVLSDQIVELGARSPTAARPDHPVRLVLVACTPHVKRPADARAARPGRPRTASCGSPPISSTCRPRSSPRCIGSAGRSKCSSASSSTCWAAGIC